MKITPEMLKDAIESFTRYLKEPLLGEREGLAYRVALALCERAAGEPRAWTCEECTGLYSVPVVRHGYDAVGATVVQHDDFTPQGIREGEEISQGCKGRLIPLHALPEDGEEVTG